MLLTIMARPRFRMDRPYSRLTCAQPWIILVASACGFVGPPDRRGRSWPQKHVILDFLATNTFIDMDSSMEGGDHSDLYPHISFLSLCFI